MHAPKRLALGKPFGRISPFVLFAISAPAADGGGPPRPRSIQALNGRSKAGHRLERRGRPRHFHQRDEHRNRRERKVVSDEAASIASRAPLGSYRLTAEAPNFKMLVREGITLTTGQRRPSRSNSKRDKSPKSSP